MGCCREGWKCGSNEMCYPPSYPSPGQTDCYTTVITVTTQVPVYPTTHTDVDVSTVLTTSIVSTCVCCKRPLF